MNNRHDKTWNDVRRHYRRAFVRDSGRAETIARFSTWPDHMLSMLDRAFTNAANTGARVTRSMRRRRDALAAQLRESEDT